MEASVRDRRGVVVSNTFSVVRYTRLLRVLLATIALSSTACGWRITRAPQPAVTPATIQAETDTVDAWMLCVECIDGQRRQVIDLGARAVPILRSRLIDSLPPAHLSKLIASISNTGPTGIPPTPAAIRLQIADVAAVYRVRSAEALGFIGGADARAALCAARAMNYPRSEVRRAISDALARMNSSCP